VIQSQLSDFYIISGRNWLRTYRAKIDGKEFTVIVCDEEDQEVLFSHELREEKGRKLCPLVSTMRARKFFLFIKNVLSINVMH